MKLFITFISLFLFSNYALAKAVLEQGVFRGVILQDQKQIEHQINNSKPFAIDNEIVAALNFDENYGAKNDAGNFNETNFSARLMSNVSLAKNFSFFSVARFSNLDHNFEDSSGALAQSDKQHKFFDNHGAYFEELGFSYDQKNYSIFLGKFNVNFGTYWQWDKNIWAHNVGKEYKQTSKLGAGAIYRLGDKMKTGKYNFSFFAFKNDDSFLNNTIMASRQQTQQEKNIGNSPNLNSYNAALDMEFDFGNKGLLQEKLFYHFSYLDMAVKNSSNNQVSAKNQKSYALAMDYQYPINENLSLDSLLEYVRIKDSQGNENFADKYVNANFIGRFNVNWNLTLALSKHRQSYQMASDLNFAELSSGYEFGKTKFFDRLTLQFGHKISRTKNYPYANKNGYGAMLRYYKNF